MPSVEVEFNIFGDDSNRIMCKWFDEKFIEINDYGEYESVQSTIIIHRDMAKHLIESLKLLEADIIPKTIDAKTK